MHGSDIQRAPSRGIFDRLCVSYTESNADRVPRPGSLLRIDFGQVDNAITPTSAGLSISVAAPRLLDQTVIEDWRVEALVQSGRCEDLAYAHTGQLMAVGLVVRNDADLERLAGAAYRRIIGFCESRGFPHLHRIWNYIPGINVFDQAVGMERYQAFCVGRHGAFAGVRDFETRLPSASALGCVGKELLIYALAGRTPGYQVENPRQMSAFRYPVCYGPKSPSFSRATGVSNGEGNALFISGTASIRGHESLHSDNVDAQVLETLENMQSVIDNARSVGLASIDDIRHLDQLKVYIRHAAHAPLVRDAITRRLGGLPPCVFLQADICRSSLLVEIEGLHLA